MYVIPRNVLCFCLVQTSLRKIEYHGFLNQGIPVPSVFGVKPWCQKHCGIPQDFASFGEAPLISLGKLSSGGQIGSISRSLTPWTWNQDLLSSNLWPSVYYLCNLSFYMSQFPHLYHNMRVDHTYLIRKWWGTNKSVFMKHLEQWLLHCKCHIIVYYFSGEHILLTWVYNVVYKFLSIL